MESIRFAKIQEVFGYLSNELHELRISSLGMYIHYYLALTKRDCKYQYILSQAIEHMQLYSKISENHESDSSFTPRQA